MSIDTANKFFVSVRANDICFLRPIPQVISKADALLLAAYLVTLSDDNDTFGDIIEAVQNT